MKMSFQSLAPGAEPWLETLAQTPILRQAGDTAWAFAAIEAAHLLSLAVLGGAVLALNLRLFGLGLVSETPAEVERRTRPWLHLGVAGALATGLIMSAMNARTLYPSPAFFVKMAALLAAILFSYAVAREAALAPAGRSRTGIAAGVTALVIWAFASFVFATTPGVNGGVALVVLAGAGLLIATARRRRVLLVGGLAGLIVVGWLVTHLVLAAQPAIAPQVGAGFAAAAFLFAVGVGAVELKEQAGVGEAPGRLAAFASTLAWVTVAAAGRWIGFS